MFDYYMYSRVKNNNKQSLCYDPRKTAFVKAKDQEKECDWTGLKLSGDLISTNGSIVRLIDTLHGKPLPPYTGQLYNKWIPIEVSFSPDSLFVFSGLTDGKMHVWNDDTGYKVCILNGDDPARVQCVQFDPKHLMLEFACSNMAFWLPTVDEVA